MKTMRSRKKKKNKKIKKIHIISTKLPILREFVNFENFISLFFSKFITYLDACSVINLLNTRKIYLNYCENIVSKLELPKHLYHEIEHKEGSKILNSATDAVKDYYALQYIQQLIATKDKFEKIANVTKYLTAGKVLAQMGAIDPKQKINAEWKKIIANKKEQSLQEEEKMQSEVISRLTRLGIENPENQAAQLNKFFLNKTVMVTSFNFNLLQATNHKFVNYFHRVKESYYSASDTYFNNRLTAELIHYSAIDTRDLQAYATNADAHPCYATLQNYPVQSIQRFGKNFVVLNPRLRTHATAAFGAPFSIVQSNHTEYKQPVSFAKSSYSLISQLPDERLSYYSKALAGDNKPEDHLTPFLEEKSKYIEVQLPTFTLNDVDLTYFSLDDKVPALSDIYSLKHKLPVIIGNNPFDSKEFTKAFQANKIENFLLQKTCEYIYEAALIAGETDRAHLKIKFKRNKIKCHFNITQNATEFHQAQAAKILYLFGVKNYFEKESAMDLDATTINYYLPLDGTEKQLGGLDDHDAYTYHHRSLGQLLNRFLKSLISVLLVCRQNETHWEKYHTHLQATIKGSTEESNQTCELKLFDPDHPYTIDVHWSYDNLVIEVSEASSKNWVMKCLEDFLGKENIESHQNRILVKLSLASILQTFRKNWHSYKAVALIEDKEQSGDLILALRKSSTKIFGYQFSGGHNNDPLGYVDLAKDIEFGKVRNNAAAFKKHLRLFHKHDSTATAYYIFPYSGLEEVKLEESEFKTDTLQRFSLCKLGNLEEKQIESVATHFDLTVADYHKNFGNALPLTPYDSIITYIQFCEKEIEKLFDNKVSVHIQKNMNTVIFNDVKYLLPDKQFGIIDINGDESELTKVIYFFKKNLQESILLVEKDKISISNINPHAILFFDQKFSYRYQLTELELKDQVDFLKLSPEEFEAAVVKLSQENPKFDFFNAFVSRSEELFEKLLSCTPSKLPCFNLNEKSFLHLLTLAIKALAYHWIEFLITAPTSIIIDKVDKDELTSLILAEVSNRNPNILQAALASSLIFHFDLSAKLIDFVAKKYYPAILMKGPRNDTILFCFAAVTHPQLLSYALDFIKAGVDVNAQDIEGNTALHYLAAINRKLAMLFVEKCKADTTIKNNKGELPLTHKIPLHSQNVPEFNNEKNITEFLKYLKVDDLISVEEFKTIFVSNDGITPLSEALEKKQSLVFLNFILKAENILKDKNIPKEFFLFRVLLLVVHSQSDPDDFKILKYAIEKNNPCELINLFQLLKPDVNVKDKQGNTLLHIACKMPDSHAIDLLLENKADVYALNNDGFSTFSYAAKNHNCRGLQRLIDFSKSNPHPTLTPDDKLIAQLTKESESSSKSEMQLVKFGFWRTASLESLIKPAEPDVNVSLVP